MRKIISFLLVFLTLISLSFTAFTAAEADIVTSGVCAVVTNESGKTVLSGTEAEEVPDDFNEYELYIDKEQVLSVGAQFDQSAAAALPLPQLYHVDFMLPDSTVQIYLTGLRSDNVEEIQNRIVEAYSGGSSFDLSDLTFIDTEKTSIPDGDENLCWAASSSNILYSTGWAARAGFADEDELFDLFAENFTDDGLHQENAMAWFFNGAALKNNQLLNSGAGIRNYPGSGGYFREYAYDKVSGYTSIHDPLYMNSMYEKLISGYGLSLGITLERSSGVNGSHAITLWGMAVDLSYDISDHDRYKGILVSDSDSHMVDDPDRRNADRILSYYPLYVNRYKRFSFDYILGYTAVLDDCEYLLPYSRNVPRETDLSASRDKANYPDLALFRTYLTDTDNTFLSDTLFESGCNLNFGYDVCSAADKAWRHPIKTMRTIVSSAGEVLFSDVDTITVPMLSGIKYTEYTDPRFSSVENVPAGDYTLTYTVNPDHDYTEAFYYNNTASVEFKVRDSYFIGDYDNNGEVEVIDATLIQRRLEEFIDADPKAEERGDVDENGLDIIDVTLIQRSLSDLGIPYEVGTKTLYTEI